MFLATVISRCAAAAVKRDLKNVSPHITSNYSTRTHHSDWNERTNCTININRHYDRRRASPACSSAAVCRSGDLDRFGFEDVEISYCTDEIAIEHRGMLAIWLIVAVTYRI